MFQVCNCYPFPTIRKITRICIQTYVKVIKRRSCELKHVFSSIIPSNHPSLRKEEPGRKKSVFEIIYGIDIPSSFKFDTRILSQLASDPGESLATAISKLMNSTDFIAIDFICNPTNIKYMKILDLFYL